MLSAWQRSAYRRADMDSYNCINCGRQLTYDEVAIHRKLVNRYAAGFLCKYCLAAYFNCSVEAIDERIKYFKAMGCSLFK